MKSQRFINYFEFKFCCYRERNKLHVDSYKFYSNSITSLLSFENLVQSLTEITKLKKILFTDQQIEVFSSFFTNCYLPKELEDIQTMNKPEKKENIELLTTPCNDFFESLKNRRLLEQMCLEMIACTKSVDN